MILKKHFYTIIKRLIWGAKVDNTHYISYLQKKGMAIGEGTVFYDPPSNVVDEMYPSLLKIGKNVRITHGVIILTHDYSWSVIAGKYGECLGGVAPVTIGNNVFIGVNTIITKGCKVEDNVIIGAGSVVTGNCMADSVYAGVPAKKIMTIEQYRDKKKKEQISDIKAILCASDNTAIRRLVLREYEPAFIDYRSQSVQELISDTGYTNICNTFYKNHERLFSDYDELLHNVEK